MIRALGAYVFLQFGWWAYLLAQTGGDRAKWMVMGEGSVFALLLLWGFYALDRSLRNERARAERERNLLLGVTHELKTPLSSLQLGLDSLRRLSLSDEDQQQVLHNMQEGVSDLGSRIEDMLLATRLQGETGMDGEALDAQKVALDVAGKLGPKDAERLVLDIQDSLVIWGDEALWVLALSNLVDNALKYSKGRVLVRMFMRGQRGVVEVEDEGKGIQSDRQKDAWKAFVRFHEDQPGTGLGLYLVAQTARIHEASVTMRQLKPNGFSVGIDGLKASQLQA